MLQIKHKPTCFAGAPTYSPVYGILTCQWCGASIQYRTHQTNTTVEVIVTPYGYAVKPEKGQSDD